MKTYYNDTLREVSFQNKSLAISDASDLFKVLTDHKKSYMGFIDVYDEIIIFSWLEPDKWVIDHPTIPDTLHRQRYATKDDCLHIIEQVFQEKDIYRFPDFVEVPVQEFTLDEMLAFKKEDEALLNEEEIPVQTAPPKAIAKPVTKKPKRNSTPSMVMGEQLGGSKKNSPASPQPTKVPITKQTTPPKSIAKSATKPTNTPKPATPDEDSFFSL